MVTVPALGSRLPPAQFAPSPRKNRRRWIGWGFLAPFMVVFLFALVAPVIYAIYLSVFQDKLVGGNSFAGLTNYTTALLDPQFYTAFLRVALLLLVQVPIMLVLSTIAALALDSSRLYFSALVRIPI